MAEQIGQNNEEELARLRHKEHVQRQFDATSFLDHREALALKRKKTSNLDEFHDEHIKLDTTLPLGITKALEGSDEPAQLDSVEALKKSLVSGQDIIEKKLDDVVKGKAGGKPKDWINEISQLTPDEE